MLLRSTLEAVMARRSLGEETIQLVPLESLQMFPFFFEVGVGTKETHLVPLCLPLRFEVLGHTATEVGNSESWELP